MALKTKIDYFGLATAGFEVASTSENRSIGTAEAQGDDGFVVAVESFGEKLAPSCEYVVTADATLSGVVLGSVTTIDGKTIALGNVSITTKAGQAPTMSASGQQIEEDGKAHCTCTLGAIALSGLFHAQDFGLFTVTSGQLTDSTFSAEGSIGTAEVDGVVKSSDLVGGKVTVSCTIVGVSDTGTITKPTVTLKAFGGKTGVFTAPLSENNPNGDFPTYSFTAEWALSAD